MKLTSREPTPEMVEAERVKFEAWCDAEGIDASYWLRCDKHTGYENGQTADYWTGWKARARHDAAPQPAALPEARYTEDEIADACMLAEIPDSKFESLLLVLKGKQ